MKRSFLLLAVLSILLPGLSASAKGNKSWEPLFATDLSNALCDKNVWTYQSGVLSATEDQAIWSLKEYSNFALELEFKNDHGTNSGVVVYCTDRENWIPNSVEIQIADDYCEKWSTSPVDWQCAAIFGHLGAKKQKVVNKPGEWNTFRVVCKGKSITVELNGQQVTEMDMNKWTSGTVNPDGSPIPSWLPKPFAEIPTKGFIGLQGKHGDALIWFRNIKIKEL